MIETARGFLSVQNFSNREKIVFALLKVVLHVQVWWQTYYDKNATYMSESFGVESTWAYFVEALKEQFYPVGNYDDQHTRWKTLCQERDQTVSKDTNIFHTLHTKLGTKVSK